MHANVAVHGLRTGQRATLYRSRGINSFQLLWDGTRWHVMSIFWHQETEDTPIPAPYLPED